MRIYDLEHENKHTSLDIFIEEKLRLRESPKSQCWKVGGPEAETSCLTWSLSSPPPGS